MVKSVEHSTFTFASDVRSAKRRRDHKAGVLHATKVTGDAGREEHAFAWLDDKDHIARVTAPLRSHGFCAGAMVFVPYSSRESWTRRYPHARPCVACDARGNTSGLPHLPEGVGDAPDPETSSLTTGARKRGSNRGKNASKLLAASNLSDKERAQLHIEIYTYFTWLCSQLTDLEAAGNGGGNKVRRGGISVPGLQNLVTKMESTFKVVGEFKQKKREESMNNENDNDENEERAGSTTNNNGDTDDNDQDGNELAAAATTGKGNGEEHTANNENDNCMPASLPMLEKSMKGDLRLVVQEMQQKSKRKGPSAAVHSNNKARTFDAMYEQVLVFKARTGHANVPTRTGVNGNLCVGRWIQDVRRRKKQLRARGLECEPHADARVPERLELPVGRGQVGLTLQFDKAAVGGMITAIEPGCVVSGYVRVGDRLLTIDGVAVAQIEILELGNEREERVFSFALADFESRKSNHCAYLSGERVARLDAIGFQWTTAKEIKSWDERLALLKQYKETNGDWPKKTTKWEGMGTWAHNQRKAHASKVPKFMADRAPKLDEIGFPWVLRTATTVRSWEDHFQQLVEFVRVNGHFNVPSEDNDNHFYTWFKQIPGWYRAHVNGEQTRLSVATSSPFAARARSAAIAREERINQLVGLGYEFTTTATSRPPPPIPDVPFERRLSQLQKIQDELGHLNIDYRYGKLDNIGGWAVEISQRYKDWQEGKEEISPLEEQQFQQLHACGFEFNIFRAERSRRSWQENFYAFLEYKALMGHGKLPNKYKADNRLGVWALAQRNNYKMLCAGNPSKMTSERHDKLEKAGFVWEIGSTD